MNGTNTSTNLPAGGDGAARKNKFSKDTCKKMEGPSPDDSYNPKNPASKQRRTKGKKRPIVGSTQFSPVETMVLLSLIIGLIFCLLSSVYIFQFLGHGRSTVGLEELTTRLIIKEKSLRSGNNDIHPHIQDFSTWKEDRHIQDFSDLKEEEHSKQTNDGDESHKTTTNAKKGKNADRLARLEKEREEAEEKRIRNVKLAAIEALKAENGGELPDGAEEQLFNEEAFKPRPIEDYKEKAEQDDKKRILDMFIDAGLTEMDDSTFQALPKWSDVTQLYGEKPVILGLEHCESFQAKGDPGEHFLSAAGIFNTGTNLMAEMLIHNCHLEDRMKKHGAPGMRWQVPWGKHNPPGNETYRLEHKSDKDKDVDANMILPAVTVRDPYYWMQSMCKHPYKAAWRRTDHCPNLTPTALEQANFTDLRGRDWFPLAVRYPDFNRHHHSLTGLWNDWYNEYKGVQFQRLFVRYEDLLFHPKTVAETVCRCGGGTMNKGKYHYEVDSAKKGKGGHGGVRTGYVDAIIKYGSDRNRYNGYHPEDLRFAREHLDPTLMQEFGYKYHPIELESQTRHSSKDNQQQQTNSLFVSDTDTEDKNYKNPPGTEQEGANNAVNTNSGEELEANKNNKEEVEGNAAHQPNEESQNETDADRQVRLEKQNGEAEAKRIQNVKLAAIEALKAENGGELPNGAEEQFDEEAFQPRPIDYYKEAAETNDKKHILDMFIDAGLTEMDDSTFEALPKWSDVTQLYGEKPVILGLEHCESFQAKGDPGDHFLSAAGIFNTGTNLMAEMLIHNCHLEDRMKKHGIKSKGMRWQVPWGKHNPPGNETYRLAHKSEKDKDVDANMILPAVTVRDPYYWMQSMCRHPYKAAWRRTDHCPNLIPSPTEQANYTELQDKDYFPLTVRYPDFQRHHHSLTGLWNDWYNEYKGVPFQRLFVRYEDLLFHPKAVAETVCRCGGGTMNKGKYHYEVDSAKKGKGGHGGVRTGYVDAIIKYGSDRNRYNGYWPEDLRYAREHLDPSLMHEFGYKFHPLHLEDKAETSGTAARNDAAIQSKSGIEEAKGDGNRKEVKENKEQAVEEDQKMLEGSKDVGDKSANQTVDHLDNTEVARPVVEGSEDAVNKGITQTADHLDEVEVAQQMVEESDAVEEKGSNQTAGHLDEVEATQKMVKGSEDVVGKGSNQTVDHEDEVEVAQQMVKGSEDFVDRGTNQTVAHQGEAVVARQMVKGIEDVVDKGINQTLGHLDKLEGAQQMEEGSKIVVDKGSNQTVDHEDEVEVAQQISKGSEDFVDRGTNQTVAHQGEAVVARQMVKGIEDVVDKSINQTVSHLDELEGAQQMEEGSKIVVDKDSNQRVNHLDEVEVAQEEVVA